MSFVADAPRRLSVVMLCSALALACATGVLVSSPRAAAQANAPTAAARGVLLPKDRVEVFEKVWRAVNEKYYDAAFNGADWAGAHARYLPLVEAAKSDEEFYALLNRLLGELRDGHTLFRTPRAVEANRRRQATSAGVVLREVEGVPAVFAVEPDADAARAGVEPGMIVRTIDGAGVGERLAQLKRDVIASSSERLTRLRIYNLLLVGAPDTTVKLGLERADRTTLDATLTRRIVTKDAKTVARLLPSGDAYLRFDSFREGVAKELKPLIEKFADAPALVIDLRQNSGGDVQEMLKVAGFFFNERTLMARGINRTGKPVSMLGGLVKIPLEAYAGEPGGQIYAKPVAVLVGERTASAAENFSEGLKEARRAIVVGTQTCGCVNVVNDTVNVKGGGEFQVSEIGYSSPRGLRLEGVGVTPDIIVALTLDDLRRRRDAGLEAAEKFLRSPVNK